MLTTFFILYILNHQPIINYDGYIVINVTKSPCNDCGSIVRHEVSNVFLFKNDAELSIFINYYKEDSNRYFILTLDYPKPNQVRFDVLGEDFNDSKIKQVKDSLYSYGYSYRMLKVDRNQAIDTILANNNLSVNSKEPYNGKLIVFAVKKLKLIDMGYACTSLVSMRRFIKFDEFPNFKQYVLADKDFSKFKPVYTLIPANSH